jgi:hypothetical protein
MQTPLWNIRSGKFAGWNIDNSVYDATGKNVGPVVNGLIYSCDGRCVGEMYDDRFVGKQTSKSYPSGAHYMAYASIAIMHMSDVAGMAVAGWIDPEF